MDYMSQEEKEYIRFVLELNNKVNEIKKEYNKLSDKNKYRFQILVEEMMKMNIMMNLK